MMLRAAPTEVKGRYTRGSLLPHAPEAKLPRLHQRFVAKKYVAQQNVCSRVLLPHIKLVWFDMNEQAPGANLLHESVSGANSLVCTEICLPCKTREQQFCCATYARNRWCRRRSFSPGACSRSVLREQAPSSCLSCVLAGVLTQERVSGACFRSKLPRVYRPLSTYLLCQR